LKNIPKVLLIFFLVVPYVTAQKTTQQATIRELVGTVEYKTNNNAAWEKAKAGIILNGDTIISTGFKSIAVLAVGNSLVTVKPLTRLSITELSRVQDAETVELNLTAGRIHAEVQPPAGGKTDFTVHSSSATASVRGTVFDFDTLNLMVAEGTVNFTGASGVPVVIDAGRASFVNESSGRAAPPEETAAVDLAPPLPTTTTDVLPPVFTQPAAAGKTVDLSIIVKF